MKAALLFAFATTFLFVCRASAVEAASADCPALLTSRSSDAARTAVAAEESEGQADSVERVVGKPARTAGSLLRSLLHLGQKKSDGLIVKDSASCRVALNAGYGKVTPVAAKGLTTVVVVTW